MTLSMKAAAILMALCAAQGRAGQNLEGLSSDAEQEFSRNAATEIRPLERTIPPNFSWSWFEAERAFMEDDSKAPDFNALQGSWDRIGRVLKTDPYSGRLEGGDLDAAVKNIGLDLAQRSSGEWIVFLKKEPFRPMQAVVMNEHKNGPAECMILAGNTPYLFMVTHIDDSIMKGWSCRAVGGSNDHLLCRVDYSWKTEDGVGQKAQVYEAYARER